MIISDNVKTFKAAAAWISQLMKSEALHDCLAKNGINLDFILVKSPWRGGFYERTSGDLKTMIWQKLG